MYGLEKNVDGSLKHGCILDEHFPGLTCWYKDGLLHRDEGPAISWEDNHYSAWIQYGQYHRLNGPALEYSNGHQEWWVNGQKHREDGPAVIDGKIKLWFIQGVQYTKEEFNLYLKKKKLNNILQFKLKNEQIKPNKSQLKV